MTQSPGFEPRKSFGEFLPTIVDAMIVGIMGVYLFQAVMHLILELASSLNSTRYGLSEAQLRSLVQKAKMSGSPSAISLEDFLKGMEPDIRAYLLLMSSPTSSASSDSETSSNGLHEMGEKEIVDLSLEASDLGKSP